MKIFLTFTVLGIIIELCQGVSIDVLEAEASDCLHPPVQIICKSTADELQAAKNQLTITHGGLTLASCSHDTGMCTTASRRFNVTMDGVRAVLTITNMDAFYDSNTWSCDVGSNTASMKLKYFRAENDDLTKQFISLRGVTVVDLLILLVVLIILVVLILQLLCRNCCERRSDNDSECWSCGGNLCCRRKENETKTGYTGNKYDVKMSYKIDDPHHVPDAKFKDGRDRKTEAEDACKNVTGPKKEIIAEKLTEWTEVRKPLVSTTSNENV